MWRRGVVVITTAQLHSTKPELRFSAGSNPARGVSEIRYGEDLWQWPRLEISLNAFRRSTIPQKTIHHHHHHHLMKAFISKFLNFEFLTLRFCTYLDLLKTRYYVWSDIGWVAHICMTDMTWCLTFYFISLLSCFHGNDKYQWNLVKRTTWNSQPNIFSVNNFCLLTELCFIHSILILSRLWV